MPVNGNRTPGLRREFKSSIATEQKDFTDYLQRRGEPPGGVEKKFKRDRLTMKKMWLSLMDNFRKQAEWNHLSGSEV